MQRNAQPMQLLEKLKNLTLLINQNVLNAEFAWILVNLPPSQTAKREEHIKHDRISEFDH